MISRARVTGLVDKGAEKGALLYSEKELSDAATGRIIARTRATTVLRGDGGFSGPAGPIRQPYAMPETPDQKARVAKLQQMPPDKNALLAVYLASDAAKGVTGQVFATCMNEIVLMSQSRSIRSVHRAEGWTPATIAEHAMPALGPSLLPLDRSQDAFSWDPV